MFLEGGNDIFAVLLNISVENVTRGLQIAIVAGPIVTGAATYAICKSLKASQAHPARRSAGEVLRRTPSGGYETVPVEPTSE
jgi:hypothetical protein